MKPDESASTGGEPALEGSGKDAILGFADRLRLARVARPERRQTFEGWVVFRVSNRTLALPVSHVREILRLEEITGVPNAPNPVAGVMNLRGHVLPVVDSHDLLGLPRQLATDSSRVLVFVLEGRDVGLIVDGVSGLERLQAELVQAVPASEPLAKLARGSLPRGEHEPLLLLEPARLLAGESLAFD